MSALPGVFQQDITLPEQIQSQMSQKTMVISQNAMQRMQQKHAMLSLLQEEEIKVRGKRFGVRAFSCMFRGSVPADGCARMEGYNSGLV